MAKVTILGAGLMGTAVAWPLADNGHDVRLVGTHLDGAIIRSCLDRGWHPKLKRQLPDGIMPYYVEELPKALEGADLIVSGVNSLGVRWIAHTLGPLLWPGATMIAVTKGLEADADGEPAHPARPAARRAAREYPRPVSLNAIGGPCIAGELAGRRHTSVVFTGRDAEILPAAAPALPYDQYYHVWTSTDMVGVEVCAALKNAYTLAVGMATGMLDLEGGPDDAGAFMHNVAAALFGASAREMSRIVGPAGRRHRERSVAAGRRRPVRHLRRRAHHPHGPAARRGPDLHGGRAADGRRDPRGRVHREADGPGAARMGAARARSASQELPLLRMLCRVITEDAKVDIPFDRLFD